MKALLEYKPLSQRRRNHTGAEPAYRLVLDKIAGLGYQLIFY